MIKGRLRQRHRRTITYTRQKQPDHTSVAQETINQTAKKELELGSQGRKTVLLERKRYCEGQASTTSWLESIAALGQPDQSSLKLYNQLKKAKSSALFQAKTRRIGLQKFLASAKASGIESRECLCRKERETAEHMLLFQDNRPYTTQSRGV